MSAPTLYHLGQEYLALEQLLVEAEEAGHDLRGPEVAAIVARWYGALDGQLADKFTRIVQFVREEVAKADVVDVEIERLRKLGASRRGRAERLKDVMHAAMTQAHLRRVDTPMGVVSIAGNGGKEPLVVDPVDPDEVAVTHPHLVEVRTAINNDAVRAAIGAGETLPFARLAPRGEHLRIR